MFELPELPYGESELEPFMSRETLREHHGKHHRKYVDTLNELVAGSPLATETLETIIRHTAGSADAEERKMFNNAAQHWNHSFFWQSTGPGGSGEPGPELSALIERDLGGLAGFHDEFLGQASEHFGSGWAWLVFDGTSLAVMTTHDADTPLAQGKTALLGCDLWEHAYYLDFQSRRAEYLAAWLEHLVQWQFAEQNLSENGHGAHPELTFAPDEPVAW